MRRASSLLGAAVVLAAAASAFGFAWDVTYEGDVLPDLALPPWEHGPANGTTALGVDDGTTLLRLSNLNGVDVYGANEWNRFSDPYMAAAPAAFEYNNPAFPGETFNRDYRVCSTIEWRMRIVDRPSITVGDRVGVKLRIAENGNDRVLLEMYYDKDLQCVRNAQYAWGAHPGLTGPEGSETPFNNDGFPNIAPGVWHTYKVVHVKLNNASGRHRELWLDGSYIGRWSTDVIQSGSTFPPLVSLQNGAGAAPEAAVEFDYVRWSNEPDGRFVRPVPAATAPTLLINQSFDEPAGAHQGWFGAYADDAARPPAFPYQTIDGSGRWGNGRGMAEAGLERKQFWQTVPVLPGETVTFNGYICAKGDPTNGRSTSVNLVSLYDGPTPEGTPVATGTVDQNTPTTLGQWAQLSLPSVPCSSGHITVLFENTLTVLSGATLDAAAYADGFTLTSSGPSCAAQYTLSSVVPASAPRGADAIVTIQGSGLDAATRVNLVNIANQAAIPCTINQKAGDQMSVTIPTSGQALAKYNVVVEGPNCAPQQLVEAFEIICDNTTTVTGLSPSSLSFPRAEVPFTITGVNLDPAQTTFKLVLGETQLVGINPHLEGNDLKVSFYLGNAPLGYYDLVAESASPCALPPPLIGALEYLPAAGQELIVNGGFETGTIDPWIEGCLTDNLIAAGVGPHSGTWFLGASSIGGEQDCVAEQQVTLPQGPGEYDLTLVFWAWVYDFGTNESGYDSRVTGEIVVDGEPVAVAIVSTLDRPMQTYIPVAVRWTGVVNQSLSARMTLRADGRDKHGPYQYQGVAAADDVRLFIPGIACNDPFADADGDQDVDQDDFAQLQRCMTIGIPDGGIPAEPAYCGCFDRPLGSPPMRNGAINSADLAAFEICASGAGVPATTACDGLP